MIPMLREFCIGCAAYPLLELAWRGRTHWTMALAGGASLAMLRLIHDKTSLPFVGQALLGGAGVTAIELAIGLCFNSRYKIWDYRNAPFNLRGQVCLPYSLAWCGLSAATLYALRFT